MSAQISFAVVGLGNIGKRHVQHILHNPEARLAAICDTDDAKRTAAEAYGVPFYNNIADMLAQSPADVVNVCTPNYLHCDHTIQSLAAGSHAVCEKPMALSTEECDQMIAAADRYGKTIFAVKQNRYNPPVQVVKQLLQEGKLGKVFLVQVNCFWNRNEHYYNESDWRGSKRMDGGCLFTQFSHFVDILYYLFGKIESATGLIHNYHHAYTELEDTGTFTLQLGSGAMANFNFSTNAFQKNMEGAFTILAEKGTVKIGGQYLNTIEYQQIADITLPEVNITAKANDYGLYQGSMSNHDKVIANVVDHLKGRAAVMTSDKEGRDVIEMIEQMYAGARKDV